MASVVLTLGVAGFAVYSQGLPAAPAAAAELNASLALEGDVEEEEGAPAVTSYDLSAHQTLSRVVLLIREHYVDPDRIKPYDMFLAALNNIQRTVPEVVIDDSEAPRRVKVAVSTVEQVFDLGGLDQLWEVTMALRDIFRFLQSRIDDPEERREIEYAAINGMLSTLDPHSVLLKPENFDEVKLSTKGEFGGLGIVISIRDGALTIISPIEGTPASRAGLKAKDKIVKIAEESTVNMNLEEAVHRLRGKPGSKVAIWVTRKGFTEPKKFLLTRAIIKIESVSSEMLDDGIGYVKIKSFQNNTYDDLHTHLSRLRSKNKGELKGLVLDLRNNPGGLLDQAILISDRFIERGPLVITVGEGDKKREVKSAHFSGTESAYPIIVLVNGGSASASEIVSGALQNHDRALVIGQQTFGKGSVQVLYDFKDKSALKLTIAQYLTPGDISIQSVGITPDVEIVPATVSKEQIRLFVDDDAPREKDLDMHLERVQADEPRPESKSPVRLVHVVPQEENDPEAQEEEEAADKFEYDFETRLAHDLLAEATAGTTLGQKSDRKALMTEAAPLFTQKGAEQEKVIADQLQALGVDWSKGEPAGSPRAEVELKVGGGDTAKVKAGETLVVSAKVTNSGDAPLYRVYGVTESDNPLLDKLELVFGKLMPGQSRKWEVSVKLPGDLNPRADSIAMKLGDQHGVTKDSSASGFVTIRAKERPHFAYGIQVDDRAKGNGDGVLQIGEEVDLKISVTNVGAGDAEDAQVTVKNMAGKAVFLDRGRDKLGVLKVGESKSGLVHFSVREPIESVELRVSVWDGVIGSTLTETVDLPVLQPRAAKPEARTIKVAKETAIYSGADDKMPVLGWVLPGATLGSDAAFGDFRRVEAAAGVVGFVKAADGVVAKGSAKRAGKDSVRLAKGEAPPSLSLDLDTMITTNETLRLRGSVKDDAPLRDMFIFVNDRKILYQSLRERQSNGGKFEVPIDVSLPLKEGSNAVAVVVRQDEDLVTRQIFGIYRDKPKVVAERQSDTPPVQSAQ